MKVTIYGSGYVGLVTGACLADVGNDVLCVDVDEEKIENLKKGIVPIFEPGLTRIINECREMGQIDFTTDMARAVAHAEIQFIAVGTPPDEDGSADLQYVLGVAKTIGDHMTSTKVVIDKSTVPVGTADKVKAKITERLQGRGEKHEFHVVSNPEFLKEGDAISDFMKPDRIVVGVDSDYAINAMRELYAPFSRNHQKLIQMDIRSAELTKYAANAMLATKISFMNEISQLAEKLGADIEQVRIGIGSDPRVGYQFIYPGCGYGGSCFPKDVKALERTAREVGFDAGLLAAVEARNEDQKQVLFRKIHQHFDGDLKGKTVAIWGLAFKPNTDDMREAPSRVLMEALWDAGAKVRAYDPQAIEETQRIYKDRDDLELLTHPDDALQGADVLAICTEWKNFRSPDFEKIRETLASPVIFDGRNLYDPQRLAEYGIQYYSIGRG
ncbi:MAG TPA: UDP-glucose 6-dehydrogenase [Gammaproteobacteria bacterium]|nr:UDP-glucose 6-dehydrogenase [Gammaproteobacteria bacterium]